jgi:hypothetical protein
VSGAFIFGVDARKLGSPNHSPLLVAKRVSSLTLVARVGHRARHEEED